MRRIVLVCALLATLALASLPPNEANAKGGSAVSIAPDEGAIGSAVQLWSEYWDSDVDVQIYAGFSPSLDRPPTTFSGPVATVRSGSDGHWRARLRVESAAGLEIPNEPGFVFFRAQTRGDFTSQYVTGEVTTLFALIVDGRRPDGAGRLRLTVSVTSGVADEVFYLAWKRTREHQFSLVGGDYVNHYRPFQRTIPWLADGDWDVLVAPASGRQLIGGGPFEQVHARQCLVDMSQVDSSCELENVCLAAWAPLCHGQERLVTVKRVSIHEGSVEDIELVLGYPGESLPASDSGFSTSALLGALLLGGGALLLIGYRLRARRGAA